MGQFGKIIADAAVLGPRYANRLCKDIPAEIFGSLAKTSDGTIDSNHPAFVIGHLCLYPAKVLELLKLPNDSIRASDHYQKLFSKDAKCVDDSVCQLYPGKEELMGTFDRAYQTAFEALHQIDDQLLLSENPVDSPIKTFVPTLGALVGFYLGGHVMSHCGQISAWRRILKLPPA